MTLSEVEEVAGYVGNFRVKVRQKARFVKEGECTACGDCARVCPVVKPDEYQMGLSSRKAIHIPFPQAMPSAYVVNPADCLGQNPIACGKCIEACQKHCVDFDMRDEIIDLRVGAIVVATGMEAYDPTALDEYGYTRYENVVTSLEFERLINAGGPTAGQLVRPSDGAAPKRIGFIQCVGSRSYRRGKPYCSNVCCMNTIKDTLLLKEHYPDTEISVFYMDIRAFGKGFEDLFNRSRESGVRYIRGLPERIASNGNGDLKLRVENTTAGRIEDFELDMLVLSVGLEPRQDFEKLRQLLALSQTSDGFVLESHPKLKPVDAPTAGVFLAGCVEAPKDIKDSVTQASAAAARAGVLLHSGEIKLGAATAFVDKSKCTSCEVCVRVCPYGAIKASRKEKKPAEVTTALCSGCGTCAAECQFGAIDIRHFEDVQYLAQVDAALAENASDKIAAFACNWCSYAAADGAGAARQQYPPSVLIIRTMCSGRVDEDFVWRAFRLGAPVVLVSGCHFQDCHYITANRWTQKRVERLWNRMEKLGIRKERLRLEWMSAAEGNRFAKVMAELEELRKTVTPEEIEATKRALAADKKKGAEAKQ